jgi:hypothetical protein
MVPTQSNSILVDTFADPSAVPAGAASQGGSLVSWVYGKVSAWERHRDQGYSRLWGEYWRLWRGKWSQEDATRMSERSRLIAPALAQAIDMTVSEIEDGLFSKDVWFDVIDNVSPETKLDALVARDELLVDMEKVNAQDQIMEAVLNSAIFGTGIIKTVTYVGNESTIGKDPATGRTEAKDKERVYVCIESIRPDEFIPDPSGKTVSEMLGVGQRCRRPLHTVLEKIEQGLYRREALVSLTPQRRTDNMDIDSQDPSSATQPEDTTEVDIVEYHGKVPLGMLNALAPAKSAVDDILAQDPATDPRNDETLIEAIVVIANNNVLLRAIPTPFVMKDRSYIAFQHERVPGRFWGRGVAEKGYNPQKALDAGVRAYIDALGYVASPMLGIDAGRVPKGFKMDVRPGKVWLTQGPPSEVLNPVVIGQVDPNLFSLSSEMERMVQMGTGAFDTAGALNAQSSSGANSMSSNSMLMAAFAKRAKRAIRNIDRNLLQPLIKQVLHRYMQFDSTRYPQAYDFCVKASVGIIAREVEAMQMTQLIGMIPEQFGQVSLTLVQGIIDHSALPNKVEILKQINQALQPPPPEEQEKQKQLKDLQFEAVKAQAQGELLANQKTLAEIRKILAEGNKFAHQAGVEDDKVLQEQTRIKIAFQELAAFEEQNRIAMERVRLQDRQLDLKEKEISQRPKT